jgi:SEC-C motif-containing protein
MRSRFSAYALGLADYIMATTHPRFGAYQHDKNSWKKQILAFSNGARFRKLEILSNHDGDAEAFVTFTAYLNRDGDDVSFTELSRFVKDGDRWLYAEGKISPGAVA